MKDWAKENLGKVITTASVLFTLVGILIGMYIQQQLLSREIDGLKGQLRGIRNQIDDLKDDDIWYIKQWIANPANYR